MYAKSLIPGPPADLACLLATSADYDVLSDQLKERGWGVLGASFPRASAGRLTISLTGLRLVVEGEVLLFDNANPAAPPGWWRAVDALDGRCCVQVVPADVDLRSPNLGERLVQLAAEGRGVVGIIPVITDLAH